ncbi:PRAME family member 12 [Heterocephalus glaber]|uniref:PRAME family member 12 n=1 Tax=Heterocephalus glaber TaxID=10181 RepID=G5BDA0_HETGA|nr:PRAME family member 12 [Heterocephalus glaber]
MRNTEIAQTQLNIFRLPAWDLQSFQAVLDGLDVLLAQKVRPRRWKLQVLDMRNMHLNFWRVWAGNLADPGFPEVTMGREMKKDGPKLAEKQPLRVLIDLNLHLDCLDSPLHFLFKWAQERRGLLQVECRKLCIDAVSPETILNMLEIADFGFMEDVEVHGFWALFVLCNFDSYLGQMKNLQKLLLSHIHVPDCLPPDETEKLVTQLTSHFLNQHHLQELHMNNVSFLEGHLTEVLRCLKIHLETLSITHLQLSHIDWNHLSQCPSISQLKRLCLSGVRLTEFRPEPLQVLLEKVAGTLTTLYLESCGITDFHLRAIIPALSLCSQLSTLSCIQNSISVATLENLLYHTARMRNLRLELYPIPREVHSSRLGQLRDAMRRIVKPLNYPRTAWLSINEYYCPSGVWETCYLEFSECSNSIPM